MKKDVIYIDTDDEISVVADKVTSSPQKVVALVLPKRCTMLHSAVNMKILNKAATNAGKRIVLISNEKALMPIAGAAGLYVASSLQSKPIIPDVATEESADDSPVEASLEDQPLDPTKPIGALAGDQDPEEIAINDPGAEDDKPDKKAANKQKKDKKLMVPNFDSFRMKLFATIGVVIVLAVGWYFAVFVLPKATITISTKQTEVPVSVDFVANPSYEDNLPEKKLKLSTKTLDKAESKTAKATGTKDTGQKATGQVVLYNCSKDDKLSDTSRTIPAGTGISSGSFTFITQADVVVAPSGFTPSGTCKSDKPSKAVKVVAQNAGDSYNLSARTYKVSGYSTVSAVDEDGMSGGTSNVIAVVSETDCEQLKSSLIAASNSEEMKTQLLQEFEQEGLLASKDTYKVETISTVCQPEVGQEAADVTAKATFRYSASGVSTEAVTQLITEEALKSAGQGQSVTDTGLSTAALVVTSTSGATLNMNVSTTAITSVKQDEAATKELVAGKNAHEVSESLKQVNGVSDVVVETSPFWVSNVPKDQDKITIIFTATTTNE